MSLTKNNNSFNYKNKSVVLLSIDEDFKKKISKTFLDSFDKLELVSSILNINDFNNYDLIIVDLDKNDLTLTSSILAQSAKEIPVIFAVSSLENRNFLSNEDGVFLNHIYLKTCDLQLLKYQIALTFKNNSTINLYNGFYFDVNKDILYENAKQVKLTLLELDLLKFLLKNRNKIVSYDEIKEIVWKDRKYTVYGMRNIVNKIREKTYYDIIVNKSKNGYIIENYHINS